MDEGAGSERFDALVEVDLDDDERRMLIHGVIDWGGPAYGSDALAVAMGFGSLDALGEEAPVLADRLERREPLSLLDWTRVLLAKVPADARALPG